MFLNHPHVISEPGRGSRKCSRNELDDVPPLFGGCISQNCAALFCDCLVVVLPEHRRRFMSEQPAEAIHVVEKRKVT